MAGLSVISPMRNAVRFAVPQRPISLCTIKFVILKIMKTTLAHLLFATFLVPVFHLGADTPLQIAQQAYLKASNTEAGDLFGAAVAVSHDTVVVAAPYEASSASGVNGDQGDNSVPYSGAAYVFVRNGTNWMQQAYLKASNPTMDAVFGDAVAISGDIIVVGAPNEDSNATGVNGNQNDHSAFNAGAAYVFVRSGTNWSQEAYLKGSNTERGDYFGYSVSVSGNTVVVGALNEDSIAIGINGNQSDNAAKDSGAAT